MGGCYNYTNCTTALGAPVIAGAVIGSIAALACLAAAALLAGLSAAGGSVASAVAFDGSGGSVVQDSPLYDGFAGEGTNPVADGDQYEML